MSSIDPDEIVIFGDNTLRLSETMMERLRERSQNSELATHGVNIVILPREELIALHERVPIMSVENESTADRARIDRVLDANLRVNRLSLGSKPVAPTYAPPPMRTGARERERRARQEANRRKKAASAIPSHEGSRP